MKKDAASAWRAAELRRRVENRRQSALFAAKYEPGSDEEDDEPTVATAPRSPSPRRRPRVSDSLLPVLVNAKHDLYGIQNDVFESEAKQVAAIRCADQQFTVEKSMRRLKSDLAAAHSAVRNKSDRLVDLHMRVRHLSRMLNDQGEEKTFARSKIASVEGLREEQVASRVCTRCKRNFVASLFDTHSRHCTGRKVIALPNLTHGNQAEDQLIAHRKSVQSSSPPKFISQPPRNFRVAVDGVTHNAITFEWDPPIFTGSVPIIDYELRYSIRHTRRQPGGSTIHELEPTPALRASYWCQVRPVPPNRFSLTHLAAGQEYGDVCISAITKNGMSAPSNLLDVIKTAPPAPPLTTLFLTVGLVTAKTITLSWTPPMDSGGQPIIDYEISFIEAVMEETVKLDKNFLDVSEIVYKPRLVRTHSSEPTFTVTDLLSGKEHKQFQVRAVNAAGVPGPFSQPIEAIFTIAPGNEFRLLDELQAAVNARARIIDSQFLSGFMQRYERHHYINLVSRFIISMHPKLEPKVTAILARMDIPEDDDPIEEVETAPIAKRKRFEDLNDEEIILERRRQFHFRIAEIEKELKRVDYNVQWCRDRRVDLVSLIRAAETRITEKQAELERARMFRGPQMDSDVLENGLQRFYTRDLVVALEDEIEIEQLYIVDTKAEIVKTENFLRADTNLLAALQRRLQDRQDALTRFELDPEAFSRDEQDSRTASIARIRDRVLYQCFCALVEHCRENRGLKLKMTVALQRIATCKLRSALHNWRQITRSIARQDASTGGLFGAGSSGLLSATIGRGELASEARDALRQVRQTDSNLESLVWCSDQRYHSGILSLEDVKDEKYYPFWLEADAKLDVQDYEGAWRLYQLIESNVTWTDRMDLHLICQLQQRTGRVLFHLKNYDQALVRFHRALVIAGRPGAGNKQDEGVTLLQIAEVHSALGSLRQSVDHYERALLCFEALSDAKGQLECYRGLERTFARLEDLEMTAQNRSLADEIEFALRNKLNEASNRLEKLQQQLVGIGAESSKEIELERVKAIVPRLRRERIKCQYKTREEKKWSSSLEKLLSDKKTLLAQGEQDLKRALASDSTQVDSAVINGTNARYEIEDFKRKLAKMMGTVKAAEEHILKEILNSDVRVRNAQDEIKELESELYVETGALMRRMLSKEPIRCFRFNATNEALKNVIGLASHGVSTCVASAGLNGLLFDILCGACLGQAVGDPDKSHLGDPIGHQAPIVSLFYVGNRIYTGSMDATLGVWDVKDEAIGGHSCVLNKLLTNFDSAVVSIHADPQWMACGCSDCDVFVFDAISLGVLVRVIGAHEKSATAINVDSFKSTFTTGGADHRIKVWDVGDPASASASARRKVKLSHVLEAERRGDEYFNGHLHPVSCVRQVASEIVSADTSGRIVIWNLDASGRKLMRICDIHKCAVTCLQFDAMKIVSGGSDCNVCVTDFATGHLIQTLVGHQASILDLQFDRKRLVSMSADGKLRLWYWQTRIGVGADRKKYHILGAGETLKSISLKYRTSIDNLLKWNNLPDSTKLYLGQKLVVEIDTDGAASDELQTLDMAVSTQYGKLAYENLDFLAANKSKSEDIEAQWAAQRLAQLAKEYFPPIAEDDESAEKKDGQNEDGEEDVDSDEDSIMAVDSDEEKDDEEDAPKTEDDGASEAVSVS